MRARLLLLCTAALALAGSADGLAAQAEDQAAVIEWGSQLFLGHCAPCHGEDGKGAGPMAMALKTGPADLTLISKTHDDRFPRAWVIGFIDGDKPPASHGSREMPIWGALFRRTKGDAEAWARIHALTAYLATIQQE